MTLTVAVAAGGFAAGFLCGAAGLLLALADAGRRMCGRHGTMPRRDRTPAGVHSDDDLLSWVSEQDWHAVLRGCGPGGPMWPPERPPGEDAGP